MLALDEAGSPELRTFTSSDGYVSYWRRYAPHGDVRGRIVAIHGIQSHGGWYTRSSAALAEAGYEVCFLDRRGAGLNHTRRGDAPGFRRLLDDIAEFRNLLPAIDGATNLLAVSWGGKLGVGVQYRHPGLFDGLILACPGVVPKVTPPIKDRIRIARTFWRNPTKTFAVPLADPALFTASEQWQSFIASDRYALRRATARLLVHSVFLDIYLKRAWKRVTCPTLLLLGGADSVVNNSGIRRYVEKFPGDRSVIEYPGAAHTLEFEPEGHPWLGDVLGWMKARAGAQ